MRQIVISLAASLVAATAFAKDIPAVWKLTLKEGLTSVVHLDELNLDSMTAGFGRPQKNKSIDRNPLKVGGREFARGVGTHAASLMGVRTKGRAVEFRAFVGEDDEQAHGGRGSVNFVVYADGRLVAESGVVKGGEAAREIVADLRGAKEVVLVVEDGGDAAFLENKTTVGLYATTENL